MDIKDALNGLKDKAQDVLDKTDIDDKIKEKAEKVKDTVEDKVDDVLDKTDIDEKIKDKVGDIKEKF